MGLQGEISAKDQQIAALKIRYVGLDEDKKNRIGIIAKNNDEAKYPHISTCMVIEDTRSGVAHYLRMEIHRMPLLHITFGEGIR